MVLWGEMIVIGLQAFKLKFIDWDVQISRVDLYYTRICLCCASPISVFPFVLCL